MWVFPFCPFLASFGVYHNHTLFCTFPPSSLLISLNLNTNILVVLDHLVCCHPLASTINLHALNSLGMYLTTWCPLC